MMIRDAQPVGGEADAVDERAEHQFSKHPRKGSGQGQGRNLFVVDRVGIDEHRHKGDGDEGPRNALCEIQAQRVPRRARLLSLQIRHGRKSVVHLLNFPSDDEAKTRVSSIMGKAHARGGPRACMDLEAAANIGEALSGLAIMFTLLFGLRQS